jgi:hypothetical protein
VYVDFTKFKQVNAEVELYNILGQQLSKESYTKSGVYSKEIVQTEAAYIIVKALHNGEVITKKVLVGNK